MVGEQVRIDPRLILVGFEQGAVESSLFLVQMEEVILACSPT
jgi:hypothetical protein